MKRLLQRRDSMNILILDIEDKALLRAVKKHKYTEVITGTIMNPVLFPIPNLIIVNFDVIFGSNTRETILIDLAYKLHPQVVIAAVAAEWSEGLKKFATLFGVDECCTVDNLREINAVINTIS